MKVVPPWVSHIEIEQEIQPVVTEGRDGPESPDAENEELEEAWVLASGCSAGGCWCSPHRLWSLDFSPFYMLLNL